MCAAVAARGSHTREATKWLSRLGAPASAPPLRSVRPFPSALVWDDAGGRFVTLVQMSNLVFVGIVYLVLMSSALDSLHPLSPTSSATSLRLWTLVCLAAVLPTSLARRSLQA